MNFLNSNYYDYPDGEDISGKMIAANKYALFTGFAYSSADCLMKTRPQGYIRLIGRYAYFIGPYTGMATAFTITTYAAQKLRGEDDKINYILGAIAAGSICGAWQKSVQAGFFSSLIFVAAAIVKKSSLQDGWEFFPEPKNTGVHGNIWMSRHDYTLMHDPPRNWTTGKE